MAHKIGRLALVTAAALGMAPIVRAQDFLLCFTSTDTDVKTVIHAIHVGIVSMLIPVLVVLVAIILLVVRRERRESKSV